MDRSYVSGLEVGWKVKVVTQIIVAARERALCRLFIRRNVADRRVTAIICENAVDSEGKASGEIVVIVALLVDLGAIGDTWQRIDGAVLLDEAGVGAAAIACRPAAIVLATHPEELSVGCGRT